MVTDALLRAVDYRPTFLLHPPPYIAVARLLAGRHRRLMFHWTPAQEPKRIGFDTQAS